MRFRLRAWPLVAVAAAVAVGGAVATGRLSSYTLHLMVMALFYAYLATAWNMVGGYAGQHSLGHSLFVGLGAYVSTLLFVHAGVTPWIGALAGAAVTAAVGVGVGYLSFRYQVRGPYFLLVTIAFAEIARMAVANTPFTGASSGLYVPLRGDAPLLFQFADKRPYLLVIAVLLAGAVALSQLIRRSWFGSSLLAARENELAARASGVHAERLKIAALALSAALCALGGTFYAQYAMFIEPVSMLGLGLSLEMVIFAVVGGIGTVYGPAAGAVGLYLVAELTRGMAGLTRMSNFHLIVYGLVLLLVVLYCPSGLAGVVRSRRFRARSSPAVRGVSGPAHATAAATIRRAASRGETLLRVESVTKQFGGLVALSEVTVEVKVGECLGLIGPNGSGKSTLLNVISGVYRPEGGLVRLGPTILSGLRPEQVCRLGVARTFQLGQPFAGLTARENVMVGAFSRTRRWREAAAIAEAWLDRLGIIELANTALMRLNIATRKKIELARALAAQPSLLLLDECLAGLNDVERDPIIGLLRRLQAQGLTLVVVEHVMSAVSTLCDRAVVLHFGQILASGPPDAVLRDPAVITAYLGHEEVTVAAAR